MSYPPYYPNDQQPPQGYPPMGGGGGGQPPYYPTGGAGGMMPQEPQYPGMMPGYPPMQQQQPGYPPTSMPGYPMQPQQPGGYPPMGQQPGYPMGGPQQPGYPMGGQQQTGYPMGGPPQQQQQPGYPMSQPGYPMGGQPQPGGYPMGQPAHQQSGGYPGAMPSGGQTAYGAGGGGGGGVNESYQLSVQCRNLRDRDLFGKSDPLCVLSMEGPVGWQEVGRTEVVNNNLNPIWRTRFNVDRRPGLRLKFDVYDADSNTKQLKHHDFLSRMECTLDSVLSAPGMSLVAGGNDTKGSTFVITAEKATTDRNVVKIHLAARSLDKKDTFGKSDPYFILSRVAASNGAVTKIHQSEVINNVTDPTWRPFSVSVRKLCNGDYSAVLRVDVFDHDAHSAHEIIGTFSTSLGALTQAMSQRKTFAVINPAKQHKKNYRSSGEVYLKDFSISEQPGFVDTA